MEGRRIAAVVGYKRIDNLSEGVGLLIDASCPNHSGDLRDIEVRQSLEKSLRMLAELVLTITNE